MDYNPARPIRVWFGHGDEAVVDDALALAEDVIETVRARGNTMDPAIYAIGEHFGIWMLKNQEIGGDDPASPVRYQFVETTDTHRKLAKRLAVKL